MKEKMIKFVRWPAFTSFVLLVAFLIINQIITPGYLDNLYITTFLGSYGPMIIACIGLSVVLIAGGMDISLGAMMGLVNVVFVTLAEKGFSIPSTIILSLLVGILCGLLNAVFIGILRITPILTTLATSYIFNGIALFIMPSPTGTIQKPLIKWFILWLDGYGAPLVFILIAVATWLVVKRTKLGKFIYAIGENKESAYVSGVPVNGTTFFTYAYAGFLYAIAAICMTTYCSGGDASIADAQTMKCITASVIGGVLLVGGIGDAVGAAFGAISLGLMITTILAVVRSTYFTDFAQGVLMLLAVLGCTLVNRYIARKTAGKREVRHDVESAE